MSKNNRKVQIGDVVHVRGSVVGFSSVSYDTLVLFKTQHSTYELYVDTEQIVHIEPHQLQVGDKVTWGDRILNYEIRAIQNGYAWLFTDKYEPCTMGLKELEFVSK